MTNWTDTTPRATDVVAEDATTFKLTITYLDAYGDTEHHEMTGAGALAYRDLAEAPWLVHRIAKDGFAIKDGRRGVYIPPHRIVSVRFEDTL